MDDPIRGELSSLRSRNSELVEGISLTRDKCDTLLGSNETNIDTFKAKLARIVRQLEALVPPDPQKDKK